MIFVEVDPVVLHASCIPAASWMFVALNDVAMVMASEALEFLSIPQSGWYDGGRKEREHDWKFLIFREFPLTLE